MTEEDKERHRTHADRYADLPEWKREFFEMLDQEDIALIKESINFWRSAKTLGRFTTSLLKLAAAAFLTTMAVALGFKTILEWIKGGFR